MDRGSRVMLVTGAARGIGAAIARRALAEGWCAVGLDREAPEEGGAAGMRFVRADAADEDAVDAALASVRSTEGRLDALVCNAGFLVRKPLAAMTLAEWEAVIDTNLTGAFVAARAAEAMLREARGAIVTVASTRARMSEPDTFGYSASKGGLVSLTHALAVSLGPAVRANCVTPGWIDVSGEALRPEDHAQHPAGRVGVPDDVARMVLFLCDGERSGFVTGAEFVVDGGMTRKMIYAE